MAVFHRSEPVLAELPRHRSTAIATSVLGHAALIAVLVLLGLYAVEKEEREPIRLVFVEPARPPKLGVPDGGGVAAPEAEPATQTVPETRAMEYVAEPALFPPRPERKVAEKPKVKLAKPVAKPIVEQPPPAPAPIDSARAETPSDGGVAAAPRGVAEGQEAGVVGGLVGGQVGGLGSEIIPARKASVPPTVAHLVRPVYPESARLRGIEGQVVIEAVIARDGSIEPGFKVVQSIPALDGAAVEAFRKWRFTPARDASGKALRVILQLPVRFVLD